MEENVTICLNNLAIDYKTALERFAGKDELYLKYFYEFIDDTDLDTLKVHINNKDFDKVYAYAHTLKGVTGNLGIDTLYNYFCIMVTDLKAKKIDDLLVYFNLAYEYLQDARNKLDTVRNKKEND